MRKIKGFKLTLRPHEVKRRAKKSRIDLEAAGLTDVPLAKFLDAASKTVVPGVIFETFGHPDPDQAVLSSIPGLAYSVILATLHESFKTLVVSHPSVPQPLWNVLQEHALDEAVRFASGLIADEAEKDACELSPLTTLHDPVALEAALRKLDGEAKLGVSLMDGKLSPVASLAVSQSWLSKSKVKGRK
ncbi:MAG: hypothetical protein AAB036_02180 [Elusimicrobiota bacterium]